MADKEQLFRKVSLERLSSPEQLETPIRVVTPRAWRALAPLLGLHMGYLNPGIVPIGLFLGFLLGAVVGVAAMAFGKAGRRTALPFGPFLAAGTVLAVFIGQWGVDLVWHA